MVLADFSFALAIATLLTLIFALGLRRRGPWNNFWFFFGVIFLVSWEGGIWIAAVGPPLLGVNWSAFVATGTIFALVLAALSPSQSTSTVELKSPQDSATESTISRTLNIFF